MAFIDIEKLLTEISPDEPCGPDLEYDPEFVSILQDAEGKPAKLTPDGQLVEEGEEPNWREIKDRCIAMFDRTIDLRIALILVDALMCQHGIVGLRDGLRLLTQLHEQSWQSFHPQLDPDDDNDPLMRMNLIAAFAAPIGADGDPMKFQQRLRDVPLADSRQLGKFSLRDLMVASGELKPGPSNDAPVTEGLIDGAFKDTDGEALKQMGEAATEVVTISQNLDQWLTTKVGVSNAANLGTWHSLLIDLNKRVSKRISARFPGESVAGGDGAIDGQADDSGSSSANAGPSLTGGVHSRDDVLRALNKVLDYYATYEPSSPVPILIRRAQKLVTLEFIDIIRELTPAAIDQLRMIGGEEALEASNALVSTAPIPGQAPQPASAPAAQSAPTPPADDGGTVRLGGSDFMPR